MATIIIPAHNEAPLIGETLSCLLPELEADDEVIVVDNGSCDETASVAASFGERVQVLSTPVASKTHAIDLAEQCATTYPRVYMDADVLLSAGALASMKLALSSGDCLAVSPAPRMDLGRSSWAVRSYYRIWLSLPYCRAGMIGSGVYALSEAGRTRFDRFPPLIADDGYIRALFREQERRNAENAFATVRAPANLHWLMKIKTRSRMGQMQLARAFPHLVRNERKPYGLALFRIFFNPRNWAGGMVYFYVTIASRLIARRKLKNISCYRWDRDDSSRQSLPEKSA